MPAVMLTAGECYIPSGIQKFTAGAFGMCAGYKFSKNPKNNKKSKIF
jgi:hypothetical protein